LQQHCIPFSFAAGLHKHQMVNIESLRLNIRPFQLVNAWFVYSNMSIWYLLHESSRLNQKTLKKILTRLLSYESYKYFVIKTNESYDTNEYQTDTCGIYDDYIKEFWS
jgi:hypothetical protein